MVTVETLMKYITSKCGTLRRPMGKPHVVAHWHGEYVGDVWLANRLVTTKEDRTKEKNAAVVKRKISRLKVDLEISPERVALLRSGGKAASAPASVDTLVRPWINHIEALLKGKLEVTRMACSGIVTIRAAQPWYALQFNEVCREVFEEACESLAVRFRVPRSAIVVSGPIATIVIDCFANLGLPSSAAVPAAAPTSPASPGAAPSKPGRFDDATAAAAAPAITPADAAKAYVKAIAARREYVNDVLLPQVVALARDSSTALLPFELHSVAVTVDTHIATADKLVAKLDRASRTGELDWTPTNGAVAQQSSEQHVKSTPNSPLKVSKAGQPEPTSDFTIVLAAAGLVLERDLPEYEQHDRQLQVHDASQAAELKQRLAKQQEQRQRQAEARTAMEAQKPDAMDRIDVFLRNTATGRRPDGAAIKELFAVPLADVAAAAIEAVIKAIQNAVDATGLSWIATLPSALQASAAHEVREGLVLPGSPGLLDSARMAAACAKAVVAILASPALSVNTDDGTVDEEAGHTATTVAPSKDIVAARTTAMDLLVLVASSIVAAVQGSGTAQTDLPASRREANKNLAIALTTVAAPQHYELLMDIIANNGARAADEVALKLVALLAEADSKTTRDPAVLRGAWVVVMPTIDSAIHLLPSSSTLWNASGFVDAAASGFGHVLTLAARMTPTTVERLPEAAAFLITVAQLMSKQPAAVWPSASESFLTTLESILRTHREAAPPALVEASASLLLQQPHTELLLATGNALAAIEAVDETHPALHAKWSTSPPAGGGEALQAAFAQAQAQFLTRQQQQQQAPEQPA
jgi:hypothetical protein